MMQSGAMSGLPARGWQMKSLRWSLLVPALVALILLVSCSTDDKSASSNTPETVSAATVKPVPKMPEPITAAKAIEKIQGYAQKQWASDALPVQIESEPSTEANGQDGKATVWTAVFGSMRRGEIRVFKWSGSLEPNAPVRGVSATPSTSPLTPTLSSQMFQSFLLKADTDAAFDVAQKHGGEALLKKDPAQQVKYMVGFDTRTNAPVVYVIYGENIKKNKSYGVINGLSGAFYKSGKGQ